MRASRISPATLTGFGGGIALAGGQTATQYVGTLAAGQARTVFWFITYPSTFGVRNVLTVSVSDGAGGTASGSGPVTTLSMISAQAGGLTSSSSIGAGAVVGQVIPLDVTFQFKGWKAGDTFNLQPAGNATFPAGCFQLVRDSITSADANLSSVIVPGTTNQTYFVASVSSAGGGSTWNVSVRYLFKYLCSGTTATPLPYSNELSGGQLKYSANYGSGAGVPAPIPAAPSPSASFALTKTASVIQLPTGGSETYTVAIRNLSTFDVTVDSIRDVLPAGVSYVGVTAASGVNAANASAMPASGATGAIVWRGTPGTSFAIAAGATLNLVYTTTVSATAGQYVNGASGYVGTTSIGSGSATVTVGTADVAVAKSGMSAAAMSDTLKYAISLSNAGPATAFQVVARDSLPSGVTFIRATNGGSYAGGIVTWPAVASLSVGATVVDSVLVLAPATLGTLVNVAGASSPSYDPSAANNDGSAAGSRTTTTLTIAIAVSPKGTGSAAKRLPGTRYAEVFTVSNVAGLPGTYNLIAAKAGAPAFMQIDSITGAGITTHVRPDSAQVTLAARSATPVLRVVHRQCRRHRAEQRDPAGVERRAGGDDGHGLGADPPQLSHAGHLQVGEPDRNGERRRGSHLHDPVQQHRRIRCDGRRADRRRSTARRVQARERDVVAPGGDDGRRELLERRRQHMDVHAHGGWMRRAGRVRRLRHDSPLYAHAGAGAVGHAEHDRIRGARTVAAPYARPDLNTRSAGC